MVLSKKIGETYKFIINYRLYSDAKFLFKEGMKIRFTEIGFNWQHHSKFEIVQGEHKGRMFDYDPYSIYLPIIKIKNKTTFTNEKFKKLVNDLKIYNRNVRVLNAPKGRNINSYPCSEYKVITDNCFIIRNVNSGLTYINEKSDADDAMEVLNAILKYTFRNCKFKMIKLCTMSSWGNRSDSKDYADSLIQLKVIKK